MTSPRGTNDGVVITGMAILCCLGGDVPTVYDKLAVATVGLTRPQWASTSASSRHFGAVADFDPVACLGERIASGSDRFAQFALVTAQQALDDAGLAQLDPFRTGIVMGTSGGGLRALMRAQHLFETGGPSAVPPKTMIQVWPNMAAAQIAMQYQLHGPSLTVTTACASSIDSIGIATRLIEAGAIDVAIAGGTEGPGGLDFVPATDVARTRFGMSSNDEDEAGLCRPFDRDRSAIATGEGSAIVVLESAEHARRRGARVHGTIRGYASLADSYHPSSPEPSGRWEALAMRKALDDAHVEDTAEIGAIYAHGTGTRIGDAAEISAIEQTYGRRSELLVTSLKGALGHTGGAAAGMNLVMALTGMARGEILPCTGTVNVDPAISFTVPLRKAQPMATPARKIQINGFGFGGQNGSLVVAGPDR